MKMKKIFALATLLAALLPSTAGTMAAQEVELPWNVAVRAGVVGGLNENAWTYINPGKNPFGLLTHSLSATVGYDFTPQFGLRLSFAYDKNAGACNSKDAGGGFYPYTFKSMSGFVDFVANARVGKSWFIPKFYGGLGLARSFDFRKRTVGGAAWTHPWQWPNEGGYDPDKTSQTRVTITESPVFGFRLGYLGEYMVSNEVGIVTDICLEAYLDGFDGLQPTRFDQNMVATGYRGMPFDLKGIFSLGLAYHF